MRVLKRRSSVAILTAVALVGLGLTVTALAAESSAAEGTVEAPELVTPSGEENDTAMPHPGDPPAGSQRYHCCEDVMGMCTVVIGGASCPLGTTEVDCPCPEL